LTSAFNLRPYAPADQSAVIALWEKCGLLRPQNDPRKDIVRKLKVNPEFFLVAEEGGRIVGTVMAGYEGHRGWINYLGVDRPASAAAWAGSSWRKPSDCSGAPAVPRSTCW